MPDNTLLETVRATLEEERDTLRHQLEELDPSGAMHFDENFADSGQVAAEQGENRVLVGRLRETLEAVEKALVKLDDGTYGVCESCKQPIAEPRLEAMPSTAYCIECASRR